MQHLNLLKYLDKFLSVVLMFELKDSAIGDLLEAHHYMRRRGKSSFVSGVITLWRSCLLIKASFQISYSNFSKKKFRLKLLKRCENSFLFVLGILVSISVSGTVRHRYAIPTTIISMRTLSVVPFLLFFFVSNNNFFYDQIPSRRLTFEDKPKISLESFYSRFPL